MINAIRRIAKLQHLLLFLAVTWLPVSARSAEPNVEIGYVENIIGDISKATVKRGDNKNEKVEPLTICAIIFNGDKVSITDPAGKVLLRIVGQKDLKTITAASNEATVTAEVAKRGFSNGLYLWVLSSIPKLENKPRATVAMSVRSGKSGPLASPMLADEQSIPAGQQSLWVAWEGGAALATVSIRSQKGQLIASGRGTGWAWKSPPVNLIPGSYRIEISTSQERIEGRLAVIAASAMPKIPSELKSDGVPSELRSMGHAAWLGAQGPRYGLAALQYIAPLADRVHPAGVLMDALVAGIRPQAP